MGNVTTANRDIKSLQPIAQQAAQLFLDTCKERGIDIFVTEYHRSQERQNYLYEQGRSRPGQIVTWTRSSNHTSGYAWDIACNKPHALYDAKIIAKAGEVAKELEIEWGGTWKEQDMPHFQISKHWKDPLKNGLKEDEVIVVMNGKESRGKLINGVSYVPSRWINENLGKSVEWDAKTKTVTIK